MIISFSERKPYVFKDSDGFVVLWRTAEKGRIVIHEVVKLGLTAAIRFAGQIDRRNIR